jgi:quercetin dioxygenase-like cupin family protein
VADTLVYRWDEIPLEKVTEMVSRKVMTGDRQTMAQVYLKRGAHVPLHRHDGEQLVYVLQGVVRWAVGGREMIVSEGEVLHVPARVSHQAEALDDAFQISVLSEEESGVRRQESKRGSA